MARPEVAESDGRLMHQVLTSRKHCGLEKKNVRTLLGEEATALNIRQALEKLIAETHPGGTVWIYVSMHGRKSSDPADSPVYLEPSGFIPARHRETGIRCDALSDWIGRIPAERVVVFLDCCYAGGIVDLAVRNHLCSELRLQRGRVVIASSRTDEESHIVPTMPNSLFTKCLVDALQGKGPRDEQGRVRLLDVFRYVSEKVPSYGYPQHPVLETESLSDDFVVAG